LDETQYIYARLKYLNDEIANLTDIYERQQDMIENILKLIDTMQSPEYARKQARTAEMVDIAEKLAMFRKMSRE